LISGWTLGVGVLGKGSEAQAEGLVGLMRQPLATQVDHLVPEQRVTDFLELRVGHLGGLHATYFGAHGGGQRTHLDLPVRSGVIVELAGWMEAHAGALWFSLHCNGTRVTLRILVPEAPFRRPYRRTLAWRRLNFTV